MPPRVKNPDPEIPEPARDDPPESDNPAPKRLRVRAPIAPPEPVVKFATWFVMKANIDKRLQAHHSEAVKAFMLSQGLSEVEPPGRYDFALRSWFGG